MKRFLSILLAIGFVTAPAAAQQAPAPMVPDPFGVTFTGSLRLQEYINYLNMYRILQNDVSLLKAHRLDLTGGVNVYLHLKQDYQRLQAVLNGDLAHASDNMAAAENAQLSQDVADLQTLTTMNSGAVGRDQLLQTMNLLLARVAADQQKQRELVIAQLNQDKAVDALTAARIRKFLNGNTGTYHIHM